MFSDLGTLSQLLGGDVPWCWRTMLGRPFLSTYPLAGCFSLMGEERNEDPIVFAS